MRVSKREKIRDHHMRGWPPEYMPRIRIRSPILLLPLIVLFVAGGCASLRPREHAVLHAELMPGSSPADVLERNGLAPLGLPDRLHLVALEVVSVDPLWTTEAIVHGDLRITRDLVISPLHLP